MTKKPAPPKPAPAPRQPAPDMHARIANRYLFTMFHKKPGDK